MRKILLQLTLLICVCDRVRAEEPAQKPQAPKIDYAKLLEQAKPGPEHAELAKLAGEWNVKLVRQVSQDQKVTIDGAGTITPVLENRFLQIAFSFEHPQENSTHLYTIGFDRRHERYTVTAMDTTGTYSVSGQGKADPEKLGIIRMSGTDDDPLMKSMGFEKKFAIVYRPTSADEFAMEIIFVDTRKQPETDIVFTTYEFTRKK